MDLPLAAWTMAAALTLPPACVTNGLPSPAAIEFRMAMECRLAKQLYAMSWMLWEVEPRCETASLKVWASRQEVLDRLERLCHVHRAVAAPSILEQRLALGDLITRHGWRAVVTGTLGD